MGHRDSTENDVNGTGSTAKTDTPVTRGRSGPVHYEVVNKHGSVCVGKFSSAIAAGAAAREWWPDQEQDPDRTGKGWDVQVVGCDQ